MNFSNINMNPNHDDGKRILSSQLGFSLIELMVAIAIGLIIVAALVALFLNVNSSNNELTKANNQIESGRFSLQVLENDIVHAGFWDTYIPQFNDFTYAGVPTDAPTAVPNPCLSYSTPWANANVTNLIGINIQVYGDTPPSGSGCVTNFSTNKKVNTDVLVVRHVELCLPGDPDCTPDTAGNLYFQSSLSYNAYCVSPLTTDSAPYTFSTTGFGTLHQRDCTTAVTEKRKFISNIYYIRDYANTVGDGIPTLMMSQFDLVGGVLAQQAAAPLVEGVESFKVELGIDSLSSSGTALNYTAPINWPDPTNLKSPTNRGDGVPDGAFVHCTDAAPCTTEQLTNVVDVKIYVLSRADKVSPGYINNKTYSLGSSTLGPYNDAYKRHVFATSVRLNNIAARRETPP